MVSVDSLSMHFTIPPFTFIAVSICIEQTSVSMLQVSIPITLIHITVWIVINPMAFSGILVPMAYIFGVVQIAKCPFAMFLIIFPISLIPSTIWIVNSSFTLSRPGFMSSNIDCFIGKNYFGQFGWIGTELRLKYPSLIEIVQPMPSFFIFAKSALKMITILVSIHSQTIFQSILELSIKEQLSFTKQLAFPMKKVFLPLSFILEISVKFILSIPSSKSIDKITSIDVSIFVDGFAFAMGECSLPLSFVLYNIIILFGNIEQFSSALDFSIKKLALVDRAIAEIIDPKATHFILMPVAIEPIPMSPDIDPVAFFLFKGDFEFALILIGIAESKLSIDFVGHWFGLFIILYIKRIKWL